MYGMLCADTLTIEACLDQGRSKIFTKTSDLKQKYLLFIINIDQRHHADKTTSYYTVNVLRNRFRAMQSTTNTHKITQLLQSWHDGNSDALGALSPLIYQELRRIAQHYFYHEKSGHTLQPTALVNEALLRLMGADVSWKDRQHFYTVAGRTMRRILIDHARSRLRKKRGGDVIMVTLDESKQPDIKEDFDLLELDKALEKLKQLDQRKHNIIELHYFAGLTMAQIADALDVSTKTIQREMRFSEAWLNKILTPAQYDT